jgi:hypothetical protein
MKAREIGLLWLCPCAMDKRTRAAGFNENDLPKNEKYMNWANSYLIRTAV